MKLCALCVLLSKRKTVTDIPTWCESRVNMNLTQINLHRGCGGGRVISETTIIPETLSKFVGKKVIVDSPSFKIWRGMKRCDPCIQGLINKGAQVLEQ